MSVDEALTLLGGVASRGQIVGLMSRAEVDRALGNGTLVAVARNRYASPQVDAARREAHRLTGAVGLLSAALLHGWAVAHRPRRPQVVVARNRKLRPGQAAGVHVLRADVGCDDVRDGVTTPERTLLDCGRRLAFVEALAVWDSALRAGYSGPRLRALARDTRGPGSAQLRRLALEASEKAANPFESVLRGTAADVPGLAVRPQVPLYGSEFLGIPDLVDTELRVVLEADSFEWHGGRADLARDARRYNRLVVHGWLVLRFAWEDVLLDEPYVREIFEGVVRERTQQDCWRCRPA